MRKYFYDKLKALKRLTGLKQYEYFLNAESPEREINSWLDDMEKARGKFGLISNEVVKHIVDEKVLGEEIIGLYPKHIYKWLSDYWSRLDSAKRQKLVQDFNKPEEPKEQGRKLSPEEEQVYIDKLKEMTDKVISKKANSSTQQDLDRKKKEHVLCQVCMGENSQDCKYCENGIRTQTKI